MFKAPKINPIALKTFLEGTQKLLSKDYDQAIPKYLEAKKNGYIGEDLKHNLAIAYHEVGVALLNSSLKQYDEAVKNFDKAIEQGFDKGEVHYNKGVAYLYLNKFSEAKSSFEAAIDKNYLDASCYYNLGIACKKLGQSDEALQNFKSAYDKDSTDIDFAHNYANTLSGTNGYATAVPIFTALLNNPAIQLVDVLCNLSKALLKQTKDSATTADQTEENIKQVQQHLEKAESLLSSINTNKDDYAFYIYNNLGTLSLNNKALAKARDYLTKASNIRNDDVSTINNLSVVLTSIAETATVENNQKALYEQARTLLINLKSDDHSIMQNLASIHNTLGETAEAQVILTTLIGEMSIDT